MLKDIFQLFGQRKARGWVRRRHGGAMTVQRLPETLEKRFAMSINQVVSVVTDGDDGAYTTVSIDSGTEVFAQHVGDSQQSLQIANNSSFGGSPETMTDVNADQSFTIPDFNSRFDALRVYEGVHYQQAGSYRPTAHPRYYADNSMVFVLPSLNVDRSEFVSGSLLVNGRQWEVTPFRPDQGSVIQLRSGVDRIDATVGFFEAQAGLEAIELGGVVAGLGLTSTDDVSLSLSYDADIALPSDSDVRYRIDTGYLLPAASNEVQINLLDIFPEDQLLPGSMHGTARLSIAGETVEVSFAVGALPLFTKQDGSDVFRVYFSQRSSEESTEDSLLRLAERLEITGRIHVNSDSISTTFRTQSQRFIYGGLFDAGAGILTVESDGYFGIEIDHVEASFYRSEAVPAASSFTLYAGRDHEVGLEVALPSPNSQIQIDSQVDIDGAPEGRAVTGQHQINLAASTIEINAPVRSYQGFVVDREGDAPLGVATEEVIINAPLTTPRADVYLTDRYDTSTPNRSQLRVGVTGAITNDDDYFETGRNNTNGNPTLADRFYILAETGDIIVEGVIAATQHTYVMQSASDDDSRFKAPFEFTTDSFGGGVGQLVGADVVVSLGNDIFGSQLTTTASSRVSIDTDIDHLRVRAASRRGDQSGVPFPYVLSVREANDLTIDAVAASSRSIDVFAGGRLTVSGAMKSGGNVSLSARQDVSANAPIETAFGTIAIEAPQVNIRGTVRVLDNIPDDTRTDISIRATDDDLDDNNNPRQALFVGNRIAAVNNVELVSENGSIGGLGLVTADTLLATAANNVILHTDVYRAKVDIQTPTITAPGTTGIIALYEEDYFAVDARNARTVVLAAQGDDAFLVDPRNPDEGHQLSSAIVARLSDTQTIFATAPSGSIDIKVVASTDVQLGNLDAADIATITETNPLFQLDTMLAAGSVSIVGEDATSVQLFDSPNALSGAISARFATQLPITSKERRDATAPDDVRWIPGQPGFDRAELEFRLPVVDVMRLTGFVGATDPDPELTPNFLEDWNQNFRESDLILVKDGAVLDVGEDAEHKVNGVYQVAERSYRQDYNGVTLMTVRLVRLQSRDQTSEVSRTHYVRVAEFGPSDEALAGQKELVEGTEESEWVSWQGVTSVGPDSDSGVGYTNIVVREIDSRPGFTPVKAATTLPIAGSYKTRAESDEEHYGQITSRIEQAIGNASELFGGVVLKQDDLVLVQFGTDQDQNPGALASARTNGIYFVKNPGRDQNINGLNGEQWVLERYRGVDENGDGKVDEVFTGIAAVNQGRLRTSLTGKMFEYTYDAINDGEIRYTPIKGRHLITEIDPDRTTYYETRIDSEIEGAAIDLTVSAASGGNNDGGTMGRMLNLLQQNQTDRPMLLSFDANLIRQDGGGTRAVVSLTEELPAITRAVSIDGKNVIVDGSGIVARSDGQELRATAQGRYFGPVRPSEVAFARRTLTRAATVGATAGANGLEFGKNTDGSIVRNLRIGGFAEGAAVVVQGADNILLENLVVGGGATEFADIGKRLTNNFGVVVRSFGEKTGFGVTLRDVSVNDATATGVYLEDGTQGVRIIESTVGSEGYRNEVGIRVGDVLAEDIETPAGEYLHQVIGVAGDPNARSLTDPSVTLSKDPEIVEGVEQWQVKVDASLVMAGLRPGLVAFDRISGRIWTVKEIATAEAEATERVATLELQDGDSWSGDENFENWTAALQFGTLMKLTEGSDVVTIPYGGLDFRNVFLGQAVSLSDPSAFATDPTVRLFLHDQAVLTASLKNDQSGQVDSVAVTHAGSGYPPGGTLDVTFSAPEGDGGEVAEGTATVDENGTIVAMNMTNPGSGYQNPPTVTLPLPSRQKQAQTVLELSEPAARSGWVFATFEVPDGRNDVAFNQTGIVLEGPAVRLVQTDVRESLGVGILVEDVQAWDETKVSSIVAGQPVIEIGGQGVTAERTWGEPDDRNVAVFANRGAGIVLTQEVFDAVGKVILDDFDEAGELAEANRKALRSHFSNYVLIAGNYLGKDVNGAEELANGTGIVRNLGTGSLTGKAAAFAEAIFRGPEGNDVREDHDRDAGEDENDRPLLPEDFVSLERYRALFRPEDFEAATDVFTFDPEIGELDPRILLDRAKIRDLETIHDRDSLSNLHGTVPKYQAGDNNPDDPVGGGGGGNGSDDGDDGNNWWDDFPILR